MTPESKKLPTIEGFTPGPWNADGPSLCIYGANCAGDTVLLADLVPADGDEIDNEALTANLRLMMGAPDLYRIAHEQRDVIRNLYAVISMEMNHRGCFCLMPEESDRTIQHTIPCRDKLKALAMAAPFLED